MHMLILMFFTNNPVCSWMESTLEQASILSHPVCSSLLLPENNDSRRKSRIGLLPVSRQFCFQLPNYKPNIAIPGLEQTQTASGLEKHHKRLGSSLSLVF